MAPKLALHNKKSLLQNKECVCYYCYKNYDVSEIKEWTDWHKDTAVCPYCSVDAVLPVTEEADKDIEILTKIHEYWF